MTSIPEKSLNSLQWQAACSAAKQIAEGWNHAGHPGGAIALFDAKGLQGEVCAGLANLTTREPFSLDSVVRFASVTKHIFAALSLLRSESGLSLDDTLGKYLPTLQAPMSDVTIGQALDMTGGLPDVRETLSLLGVSVYNVSDPEPILDFLAQMGNLNFPAGEGLSYSNTGYRLVETILQRQGLQFADLIEQYIAKPLSINLFAPESWFDIVPDLAPGYWLAKDGWKTASAGLHLSASGSLAGSLRSLMTWLQALLTNRGPGAGVLDALTSPRFLNDGTQTGYGLGLAKTKIGDYTLYGHGGSHLGYKTYFLLEPRQQIGLALVSNRDDTDSFAALIEIAATLLNAPLPRRSTALQDGLYVSHAEPYWLAINNGVANYLGTSENLYQGEDGSAVSLSAHMPIRLEQKGPLIEGEIGHAKRFFKPIESTDFLHMIQGRWYHAESKSAFDIIDDQLLMGVGTLRTAGKLTSLGQGRLLVEMSDGPWQKSFCLYFQGYNVQLISNRSRVLTFRREECRISWQPAG